MEAPLEPTPRPVGKLRANEMTCYVAALNSVLEEFHRLENLPPGVFHRTGGLLPETALAVEAVIRGLVDQGIQQPSVGRVMAEIQCRCEAN